MKNKVRALLNLGVVVISGVVIALVFYISTTFRYQLLILRRSDLVEATLQVEEQESIDIQKRITEAKNNSVKRILSPLVITQEN